MILKGDYEIVAQKRGKHTLLSNVKALCTIRVVISAPKELPENRIVTAGKAELPKAKCIWSMVTHGFLTPFGFMCQPAR